MVAVMRALMFYIIAIPRMGVCLFFFSLSFDAYVMSCHSALLPPSTVVSQWLLALSCGENGMHVYIEGYHRLA